MRREIIIPKSKSPIFIALDIAEVGITPILTQFQPLDSITPVIIDSTI